MIFIAHCLSLESCEVVMKTKAAGDGIAKLTMIGEPKSVKEERIYPLDLMSQWCKLRAAQVWMGCTGAEVSRWHKASCGVLVRLDFCNKIA